LETALLCIDEDPDTGDRVYGGYDAINIGGGYRNHGIIGVKKAGSHDMTDPRDWHWIKRYAAVSYGYAFFVCHWTAASLPSLGHKGLVLLGSVEGSHNVNSLVVIDPFSTPSGTVVQKLFRELNLAAISFTKYTLDLK
jgi:hypothetical protein